MYMNWIKLGLAGVAVASLAACGGGGGSAGNVQEQYSITLRADRTNLPINISGERPGLNGYSGSGVYAPYTTTLYVNAKEGNHPIVGGEKIFGCNVTGGLNSGSLYYLDGDPEHEVEVDVGGGQKIKIPGAYRSIVLGANAGGNSFHFHAKNEAGTARITCSVTDPRDSRVYSASVDIQVGGATQKPASVIANWAAPSYLGSQFNTNGLRNNLAMQVQVHDDANQPVPNPSSPNLQVSIIPTPASVGARLLSGAQSGSVVQVSSNNGLGLISLSSGPKRGVILLELVSDRYDNNVANGIQDPVTQLKTVSVVDAVATAPLTVPEVKDLKAVNGMTFAYAMLAEGGVPPYEWTATGLPNGLSMSTDGLIRGTPNATAGSYAFVATVTEQNGDSRTVNLVIEITGATELERAFALNCASSGASCSLPDAIAGSLYSYTFSANTANPAAPITWQFSNLPSWLKGDSATGTISGTPVAGATDPKCPPVTFTVTGTQGGQSMSRNATIAVTGSACAATPTPTPTP